MKKNTCTCLFLWALFMPLLAFSVKKEHPSPTAYYISNAGSNRNDGSLRHPFNTLDSTMLTRVNAGDTLYFMGGETFAKSLYIHSFHAGTKDRPIVITSFGDKQAVIQSGNATGLLVYNASHLKIENLHFVGNGRKGGNTQHGVCLSKCSNILVTHLTIEGYQKAGLEINCSSHIVADSIYAHDNGFGGIEVSGVYGRKDASSDILIRHCFAENNSGDPTELENHSGNGIVVGYCKKVTIEYCSATNNGWDMPRVGNGPVGIWAYEADSVLIQHCISYRNKTSKGGNDGGGFDLDGGVTNSIIQYCLSYENEGPGYCLFQYKGATPWYNNIIRYCISENDGNVSNGMGGVFIWNSSDEAKELKNGYIYNNTFYNERGGAICFEKQSKNKGFYFYNNIFVGKDDLKRGIELSGTFLGNNWYSLNAKGFNMDNERDFDQWAKTHGQEGRNGKRVGGCLLPLFKQPGQTTLTDPKQLTHYDAYRLKGKSPLHNSGVRLPPIVGQPPVKKDFNGLPVLPKGIGACR
jgi:hypothetical protein